VHLVGFIIKKFVTMHGHMIVKLSVCVDRRWGKFAEDGIYCTFMYVQYNGGQNCTTEIINKTKAS